MTEMKAATCRFTTCLALLRKWEPKPAHAIGAGNWFARDIITTFAVAFLNSFQETKSCLCSNTFRGSFQTVLSLLIFLLPFNGYYHLTACGFSNSHTFCASSKG